MSPSPEIYQKHVATRRLWIFPHVAAPVFLGSAALILAFVVLGIADHGAMADGARRVSALVLGLSGAWLARRVRARERPHGLDIPLNEKPIMR